MDYVYHITDLELNGETLLQFERVLSKYNQWVVFKREIRLNNLLGNTKLQFDIDDISEYGFLYNDEVDILLSKTCIFIVSMSLTLKDETIEKLKIKWRILNTPNGQIIKNLLDSDIKLEIKMKFSDGVFYYFYIDLPNNVA